MNTASRGEDAHPNILFVNDSYNDGRFGQYSNRSNMPEYQRGQGDAVRWNTANSEMNEKYNRKYGVAIPEGGGNFVGLLVLAFIITPVAVVSAVCALIFAFLLQKYISMMEPDSYAPGYGVAYKLMFQSSIVYQLLNVIVVILIYLLNTFGVQLPFLNPESLAQGSVTSLIISSVVIYQLPSVLITARSLQYKLSGYEKFKGFSGYLKAVLFITVLMLPVILLANYVVVSALGFYLLNQPSTLFH